MSTPVNDAVNLARAVASSNPPGSTTPEVAGITDAEFKQLLVATHGFSPAQWSQFSVDAGGVLNAEVIATLKRGGSYGDYAALVYVHQTEATVNDRAIRSPDASASFAELRANPDDFIKKCTQIDGDIGTSDDAHTCVPMAMVVGIVASDPDALGRIAKGLAAGGLDSHFPNLKRHPELRAPLERALRDFGERRATPGDVRALANALYSNRAQAPGMPEMQGSSDSDAMNMYALLRAAAGGAVPTMSLGMFSDPALNGEGHCRVEVGGRSFTTWPNDRGEAVIVDSTPGAGHASLKAGKADGAHWIMDASINLTPEGGTYKQYSGADIATGKTVKRDASKGQLPFFQSSIGFDGEHAHVS